MGTSSSYRGPTGRNPLLPPWAPDPPEPEIDDEESPEQDGDDEQSPEQNNDNEAGEQQKDPPEKKPAPVLPVVSWSGAKGIVSRIANGRPPSGSWKSAFRSYMRAHGGSRTAARSAISGRATTARLGSFLSDVIRDGIVTAARNIGLTEYLGRDAQSLLAAFIDLLAPDGALLEEAIARKALAETLSELFDRYDVEGEGISALDKVDAESMKDIITLSITNYTYERFEQELVNCIERGSVSEDDANQLADEAKGFITGMVEIDIENIDVATFDWNGAEGRAFVEDLYRMAYSFLEDKK